MLLDYKFHMKPQCKQRPERGKSATVMLRPAPKFWWRMSACRNPLRERWLKHADVAGHQRGDKIETAICPMIGYRLISRRTFLIRPSFQLTTWYGESWINEYLNTTVGKLPCAPELDLENFNCCSQQADASLKGTKMSGSRTRTWQSAEVPSGWRLW